MPAKISSSLAKPAQERRGWVAHSGDKRRVRITPSYICACRACSKILHSRGSTVADFEAVIAYFESRAEPPDDLISKVFPFDAADQALPYWVAERDRVIKVMIER